MGRGRAKAKQTKVARELKYSTTATDLDRLQRELAHADAGGTYVSHDDPDDGDRVTDRVTPYANDDEEDLAR